MERLTRLSEKKNHEPEHVANVFVDYLKNTGAIHLLGDIMTHYQKRQSSVGGITSVTLVSKNVLDDEIMNLVKEIFGRELEITQIIDPDCIGGVKLQTDDTIYDGTHESQLSRMKTVLSNRL